LRVSLGNEVTGYSNPQADPVDPLTAISGVLGRIGRTTPPIDLNRMRRFGRFVDKWLKQNMEPLPPSTDVSVDTWLEGTNYTIGRKTKLRDLYRNTIGIGKHPFYFPNDSHVVKSFGKNESYVGFKHLRGIYSRDDRFKVFCGPFFKVIEKKLFTRPEFVKKIPVQERPAYLKRRFGGVDGDVENDNECRARVFVTDYSSFEASFKALMYRNCEFKLYAYMTQLLPGGGLFMDTLDKILNGRNKCVWKHFIAYLDSRRMSGEMNTSLGNGFTNFMSFLFQMEENNIKNFDCIFEGDDGLAIYFGPKLSEKSYSDLGFIIKMTYLRCANEASFCGQLFDYDSLTVITDPIKVLLNLAWVHINYLTTSERVMRELLRAKAMSLIAQYPGCPIIQSVGECYMRLTNGYRWRFSHNESNWYRGTRTTAFGKGLRPREVSYTSRIFMERIFGITVAEQLSLEKYFNDMLLICPIWHPALERHLSKEAFLFNRTYVMRYGGDLALPNFTVTDASQDTCSVIPLQ